MKKDIDQLLGEWAEGAREAGAPPSDLERQSSRALLEKLRALPPEGDEPAWSEFERTLHATIDAAEAQRQRGIGGWFRRFWKPVFGVGLAAAAAAVVLAVHHEPASAPAPVATDDHHDAAVAPPIPPAPPAPPAPVPGHPDDDDDDAPLAFGPTGDIPDEALDDDTLDDVRAELAPDLAADDNDDDLPPVAADGLVPDLSLDWVDDLDDAQLDKVDRWLAKADGHAG